MCMVKCGNKNQLIFKGGLHVFAWQGADQCGAETCFFFWEDMTYTCTSFKKDLLRGVCYNIPVITSHLATRTKW